MANKTLQQLLQDFRKATGEMEILKNNLPRIIGVEAVKVVKQNFQLQGYDNGFGVNKWPPRSPDTNLSYDRGRGRKLGAGSRAKNQYKGSVFGSHNPILMQTRNLYSSIQYFLAGRNVTIGVDINIVPYAQKMNEGGTGSWGKNKTWPPARQYVPKPGEPPNPKILKAVAGKVEFEQNKIMKAFKK